jgi:hypothetical protein
VDRLHDQRQREQLKQINQLLRENIDLTNNNTRLTAQLRDLQGCLVVAVAVIIALGMMAAFMPN